MKASERPEDYNWIKKIIYNEVNEQSGTLFVTNQIIEKMLYDESKNLLYRSFYELSKLCYIQEKRYLGNLLDTYISLDLPNYSARIALLYAAYLFITIEGNEKYDTYINKTIARIFSFTSLNISLDHLTFNIFQLTMLIALNTYLQ